MPERRDLCHGQEGARLGLAIGVRHARQHFGDMTVVGKLDQLCDVALARRPHHQPLGDQHRAVYRVTFVF